MLAAVLVGTFSCRPVSRDHDMSAGQRARAASKSWRTLAALRICATGPACSVTCRLHSRGEQQVLLGLGAQERLLRAGGNWLHVWDLPQKCLRECASLGNWPTRQRLVLAVLLSLDVWGKRVMLTAGGLLLEGCSAPDLSKLLLVRSRSGWLGA